MLPALSRLTHYFQTFPSVGHLGLPTITQGPFRSTNVFRVVFNSRRVTLSPETLPTAPDITQPAAPPKWAEEFQIQPIRESIMAIPRTLIGIGSWQPSFTSYQSVKVRGLRRIVRR